MNKIIKLVATLTFSILINFVSAQTDSGHDPDKIFFSKNDGFNFAEYGLNGFKIRDNFKMFEYDQSSALGTNLIVGGDLVWSELGSNGLKINGCCITPASKVEINRTELTMTHDFSGQISTAKLDYDNLFFDPPFSGVDASYGVNGFTIKADGGTEISGSASQIRLENAVSGSVTTITGDGISTSMPARTNDQTTKSKAYQLSLKQVEQLKTIVYSDKLELVPENIGKILPELITKTNDTQIVGKENISIDYSKLSIVAISGLKAVKNELDKQKALNTELQNQIDDLRATVQALLEKDK